jgi:hypothetical protein
MASTVTAKTADAALVPFASVSVAVKLCVPTVSPLSSKLQALLAFNEAWPTDVVPSNTLTVLLASPVRVNVIEVAVVWPSPTGAVSGPIADGGCKRSGSSERGNTKSLSDIASTPLLTLPD